MTVVAARYASALFEIAKEKQAIESFREDLTVVENVFLNDRSIRSFFLHPNVPKTAKKRLLQ